MIISRVIFLICIVLIAVMLPAGILPAQEYSLEDLYRIALERSEKIKISEEDLYIAERGKDKAVSVLFPKLSAFGSYTRYDKDKFSSTGAVIQPEDSTSWGLRLDQSLSLSGREITAFKISKEYIEKSKYDLHAVKEAYIFNVASAYYDVLRTKKAVEIAKSNLERLTKHRDAAATRLRVGEATKTDLLRAEAELSGAQAELVKSENNLKLAKAVLARVAGLSGDYDVKEAAGSREDTADNLDSLKQTAFAERAEMKAMELQKRIAEEQVGYSKGAYWPTIAIEGVYTRREDNPAVVTVNKESIYGGIKLNFPFFEGGLRKAEVAEAEAKKRQSGLIYDDLKKTIGIEVENAYLDFQTQKGVLKSLEDQTTFARDNYNSVSRQYQFREMFL
ncbi:MAG: TolC family protein [Nitrospiraceae bacterium]|jgi:outer membrane protein|nr:TolC family protein [Nitrospiraceae bacterium]